jgi:hypothetical protein
MQDNESDAPPNLRPRVYILIVIALLLTLVIIVLNLVLTIEPPYQTTPYELTATWIAEHNATVEIFRLQTQSAVTQTHVQ